MNEFDKILSSPETEQKISRNEKTTIKYIDASRKFRKQLASYDNNYLNKVKELIKEGYISKNQIKKINKELKNSFEKLNNKTKKERIDYVYMTLDILRKYIKEEDLKTNTANTQKNEERKQIILSEFFIK